MEPATLDTNIWFTTEELEMVSHLGRAAMKKYYYTENDSYFDFVTY